MKNQSKLIIGFIFLIAIGILISSCTKSEFDWEDAGDGTWTKTDLECMKKGVLTYTCVSNCYENKEVQLRNTEGTYNVWDLGYDLSESFIEQTKTNTRIDVICFDQGCFPYSDEQKVWTVVCPAG